MERAFSIFGKITLALLVLGGLTYVGFYFGTTKNKTGTINTNVPTSTQVVVSSPLATNSQQLTTVSAGVAKSAGLSFDQYSITTPDGWVSKKESQTALDEKLILEKDGYTITIFQAATGGALCLYPGDAEFEGPSSKYQVFTTITTKDGRNLRRSGDLNGAAFTVCQKSPDGSYQQPTSYGHISIKLPSAWDDEGVKVVDSIISSLKKI